MRYQEFNVAAADVYDRYYKWEAFLQVLIFRRDVIREFKSFWLYCSKQSLIRKKNKLIHAGLLEYK